MSSEAQIDANRENALHSTGPRTEAGKETSSRNHLTSGLYTRHDYVKPDERELYQEFRDAYRLDLNPAGILEETLADEIIAASWRLRRCLAAEAQLDDDFTEATDKTRRSIERARAAAHTVFHRSLNQLRKIQTQRQIGFELLDVKSPDLADFAKVSEAVHKKHKNDRDNAKAEDALFLANLERLTAPPRAA